MQPVTMRTALIFINLLVSIFASGDVLLYTDSDFNSKLSSHDIALVKFFAPWCGHCKRLAPEFEKAASILKKNDPPVSLIEIDCTEGGKDACSEAGVSGYPTLKVYKQGSFAFDYEGPRDSSGIVKYMASKAGPSSKELKSIEDFDKFLTHDDHSIIGFFSKDDTTLNNLFQKLANSMSDKFRFAHTTDEEICKHAKQNNKIVLFQPPRLHSKLEPNSIEFDGAHDLNLLKVWVQSNIHGLVGHRTSTNQDQFTTPLVNVIYDVDYVKNPKGTNYWRNRVLKVAKKLKEEKKKLTFSIGNKNELNHELAEHGMEGDIGDEVKVIAKDEKGRKYTMADKFSMESLEKFSNDFLDGKLTPYLKSEEVPSSNNDPVKVVVAKQFDEIVNDETKDVLIEFYAPWCGHCKSLAPKYEEVATKLKDESNIVIAKMDATANDVPAPYDVRGFPTLYFAKKNNKKNPIKYEGGREVEDFISYLAKESTDPLTKYDRKGKKIKQEKVDL